MYKNILNIILFIIIFFLSLFTVDICIYAEEEAVRTVSIQGSNVSIKKTDSCTDRCHVNYLAYENKFKVTQKAELFRHKTHSFEQGMNCTSCHGNSDVNTEGHGKLTINKKSCLTCHHVELKESECKRCHQNIDGNPMKYKEEKFLHGFTVESDVDCGLCHVKDPNASLIDGEINCIKCHHTTPDLDCVKCHKDDIDGFFNVDTERGDSLSWTVSFMHSQHPWQNLSCKVCHLITHDNDAGIVEYNINCSKCHHDSEKKEVCIKCHKEPSAYLRGEIGVREIISMPDMMSRAVKCEDCHKYNSKKLKFRGVEEYCIKCHNEDYGKLFNAWTKTIKNRLEEINHRIQNLVEESNIAYAKEPDIDKERKAKTDRKLVLDTFIDEAGVTLDLITKYGTHNFNLTQLILDRLEEKIR